MCNVCQWRRVFGVLFPDDIETKHLCVHLPLAKFCTSRWIVCLVLEPEPFLVQNRKSFFFLLFFRVHFGLRAWAQAKTFLSFVAQRVARYKFYYSKFHYFSRPSICIFAVSLAFGLTRNKYNYLHITFCDPIQLRRSDKLYVAFWQRAQDTRSRSRRGGGAHRLICFTKYICHSIQSAYKCRRRHRKRHKKCIIQARVAVLSSRRRLCRMRVCARARGLAARWVIWWDKTQDDKK